MVLGLTLVAAGWSAAVIDERFLGHTLPGPASVASVLPYSLPALLAALLLLTRRHPRSRLEEGVVVWVAIVALASLTVPWFTHGSTVKALAAPALLVAVPMAWRWPAAATFAVVAFSASFGSLHAFWNFPVEKAIALVLGALWVASLAGLLFAGSRPVRLSVGALLLGAYLLITALQIPLAPDGTVAELGFKDGGWFMAVVLLVAYAGWRPATHERIARGILIVAALAGAYALLRVLIGPAKAEFQIFATTPFNFVHGKLKPGGSFGSAQDMGTWMAAVVPFCFAALLRHRGRWRLLSAVTLGLCVFATIESQLRIGLVGIVFGLVLVLALRQLSRGARGLGGTLLAALIGAGLIVAAISIAGDTSTHSFRGLLHPTSDPSFLARKYKWTQALRDLQTRPFGYGLGSASYGAQTHGRFFIAATDTNVDNGFLKVALEQGLLIMVLFAAALLTVQLGLTRRAIAAGEWIVVGAAGTLCSFLTMMLAEDATANPRSLITWVIVGLGLAAVVRRWYPDEAEVRSRSG